MQIELDEIGEEGLQRSYTEDAAYFEGLAELAAADGYRIVAPVAVEIQALKVGALVEVRGEVRTILAASCSRCLAEARVPLDGSFELTFQRHATVPPAGAEELELSAEELGLVEFEGEAIDLRASIQEQLLLALPAQPLCSPGCRGLCPHCGTDLNSGSCSCAETPFDSRFAALKKLKFDR